MTRTAMLALAAALMLPPLAHASDPSEHAVLSEDPAAAAAAVAELRTRGPAGLEELWRAHAPRLQRLRAGIVRTAEDERLLRALDAVAGQKDALYARLYWYTDVAQAKADARASGRPILSLRLLGRLDEEWSCANSRFFRTVLYADPEVADVLRSCYVLHWQSVRPVPQVTIDFGDGRVVRQTIGGNSIHYVLDADGRPVDALPGAYAAKVFLQRLSEAGDLARRLGGRPMAERDAAVRSFHAARLAALARGWSAELVSLAAPPPPVLAARTAESEERHAAIDRIYVRHEPPPSVERLARRIDAELDGGSARDPLLGLAPRDVYTALPQP